MNDDCFVVATRNPGKMEEISSILDELPLSLVSQDEFGITESAEETGDTFEENAILKAKTIMELSLLPTIADDSGLEVDFLDGAPGVYSARYAGEGATSEQMINKLLSEMKNAENRKARFVCVAALALPDGKVITAKGICEGEILCEPKGDGGFGYDPVFYVPSVGSTFSEIPASVKNTISHRAIAFEKLKEKIRKILD